MTEKKVCPMCKHTEFIKNGYVSPDKNGFRYSAQNGKFPIRVCTKCGLIYADGQDEVK